jgi:hypothetical protein
MGNRHRPARLDDNHISTANCPGDWVRMIPDMAGMYLGLGNAMLDRKRYS